MARRKPEPAVLEITGNGCYLRVRETETEGVVRLSLGHECAVVFDEREISVLALCTVLTRIWDTYGYAGAVKDHLNLFLASDVVPDIYLPIPERKR